MPVTPIPDQYLSQRLATMQRQLDELTRAVGRPSDQVRDPDDNVVHMATGVGNPVLAGRGQDVALSLSGGAVTLTDEGGRDTRDLVARSVTAPVTGDTHGVHHGDVGVPGTEAYNHYGDLHGNSYGFHYGPVGDGATQNQINAANVFANGFFGNVGIPGQNWLHYGTVITPSELSLKTAVREYRDAGDLIDRVPSYRWRWRKDSTADDGHEHAGPAVDDLAGEAPWLVRGDCGGSTRGYSDRDLIGVLWGALRDARARIAELENS